MERLVMHMQKIRNFTAITLAVSSISAASLVMAETPKTCTAGSPNCTCSPTPTTPNEVLNSVVATHNSYTQKAHTTSHVKHHKSHHEKIVHHKHTNLKGEHRLYKDERTYKDERMSHSYKTSYKSIAKTTSYRSFTKSYYKSTHTQTRVVQSDAFAEEHHFTRWYATIGAMDYSVNLPTYRLPITFGRWLPTVPPSLPPSGRDTGFNSANSKSGNRTILPFFAIGYNLKNGSQFYPNYLDQEAIELNYSQFNRATKATTDYVGATGEDAGAAYGVIWRIDNTTVPMYNGGALRIVNSYIHASAHYHDADLYLKANIKNLPSYLTSTAKVGLVVTALDQFYSYNINATTQGLTHNPIQTIGDDSLRSRYLGIGIGDTLDFRFASAFSWFISANVQGLYAMTTMTSNQTPDQDADPAGVYSDYRNNIRINDHANKATYRANALTGINIYPSFLKNTHPIKISVFGGVDQWGYVPQLMTITSFNSSGSHIGQASMRNYFVGASFSMAII